jgi:hypothetical protein
MNSQAAPRPWTFDRQHPRRILVAKLDEPHLVLVWLQSLGLCVYREDVDRRQPVGALGGLVGGLD